MGGGESEITLKPWKLLKIVIFKKIPEKENGNFVENIFLEVYQWKVP